MQFQILSFRARRFLVPALACGTLLLAGTLYAQQSKPAAPPAPPIATFIDISEKAGLTAQNIFGGLLTKKYIIETTGTGVAIFDYDNDGWPDIFLVNGTKIEGFPTGQGPTNRLYRNNHDGTFTDVTTKAGLTATGWGQGVCVGDYDNDGWEDVYITYYGKNRLYHNQNGVFTEVSDKAGVAGSGKAWGTGCAFVDYDRDGRLDLVVANYVDFDLATAPSPGDRPTCIWKGVPVMCGPRGLPGAKNILYHNRGDGTFEDVTAKAHIDRTDGHYAFSVSTLDFDEDGWPDIFIACDSTPSILYRNNHDGTFTDVAVTAGAAFNEDGREQAGMGSTVADYNGDGHLDIFKTNFSDDTSTLYKNGGDGTFTDATSAAGLGLYTQYLGWGTMFFDMDNDGWPDLILVNGHVYPEVDSQHLGSSYKEPRILFHNNGDRTFSDISASAGSGITTAASSRGLAVGDLWNDGKISDCHQQYECRAEPAGEPGSQRQSLDRIPYRGHEVESRWHRRAHPRKNRNTNSGRRSTQRLELHFQQRHARSFRTGAGCEDRMGRSPLAKRSDRAICESAGGSDPHAQRGIGRCGGNES